MTVPVGSVDEMVCVELVERVTAYFEDRLPGADRRRFDEHLAVCGPCRKYVEQFRETIELTGRLAARTWPPRITPRCSRRSATGAGLSPSQEGCNGARGSFDDGSRPGRGLAAPALERRAMPSRSRALFALPFAAMALAAPHPSVAAPTRDAEARRHGPGSRLPIAAGVFRPSTRSPALTATSSRLLPTAGGTHQWMWGRGRASFVTRNTRATLEEDDPKRDVLLARPGRDEGRRRIRVDDTAVLQAVRGLRPPRCRRPPPARGCRSPLMRFA